MDWAGALRDSVRDELDRDCSVGIAATRFAARICSRIARPRGVLLWLSGYEDGLIASLPLEELDELTPQQLAKLRAQGVRTLGEMSSLASVEARAILGSQASKLISMIRGLDRTADRSEGSRLARAVALLARRLTKRLTRCDRRARGLELRLVFDDGVARERYTLLPACAGGARRIGSCGPTSARDVPPTRTRCRRLVSHRYRPHVRTRPTQLVREHPREVEVKLGRS